MDSGISSPLCHHSCNASAAHDRDASSGVRDNEARGPMCPSQRALLHAEVVCYGYSARTCVVAVPLRQPVAGFHHLLSFSRCCHRDPLRDKTLLQQFLTCPIILICLPILNVLMGFVFAILLLDLLSFPRFFLFHHRHLAFLESVIVAHPELDPALAEEELVQKLQCLLDSLCRHHPGVHYNLCASVVHHPGRGSTASYDADVFEKQFLKFALETKP